MQPCQLVLIMGMAGTILWLCPYTESAVVSIFTYSGILAALIFVLELLIKGFLEILTIQHNL